MTKATSFTDELIAQRRAQEPSFRRFPCLFDTLVSVEKDVLRYREGSRELADFFATQQPQNHYPFVWLRNAVDVRYPAKGVEQCTFVHEVMVSYDANDVPDTAPLVFSHGEIAAKSPRAQPLMVGQSPRFIDGFKDILNTFPACVVGPSKGLPQQDESEEAETSAPAP